MLPNWQHKISHVAQLGGIETAVLDNGLGRGTRVARVNTGTGLRYKVVLDRAMDITDAFFNQHSLAWLSHSGVTVPQPFSNQGLDWLRTFGGGLLTTCGLSHVGGPETDASDPRGLHGHISNIPAEIESILQPDLHTGNLTMSITGRMRETQVLGPSLELKRNISSTLGQAVIKIQDEVINRGNAPAPHMLIYHCNLGWPLVDAGARILWKGNWQARETAPKIFHPGHDFRECLAPLDEHSGRGEEAAYIDVAPDENGQCTSGLYNAQLGMALAIRFPKAQLPWLTNWQHWGKNEYVLGLEPGTNPPIGQTKAKEQGQLIMLEPGESRKYTLEFELLSTLNQIENLLKQTDYTH